MEMHSMREHEINQLLRVFTAYTDDVVNDAIEAWKSGRIAKAQGISNKIKIRREMQKQETVKKVDNEYMPFCQCGTRLMLVDVCPSCDKWKAGYRSRIVCPKCKTDEYFKETVKEKEAMI